MSKTSAVFYGHGGYGNRGCEAIVRSTAALLRQGTPDLSITLCSQRPEGDRAQMVAGVGRVVSHTLVPLSWNRLCYALERRMGASRDALDERIQKPVIRAAQRADLSLSIGGDTYCYNPPRDLYAIDRALSRGSKPFVLWACSIDPERLEDALLDDLRRYTRIYARESITAEALRAKGLPVFSCCDPAFTLPAQEMPLPEGFEPGETVGLNLSPLSLQHAADAKEVEKGAVALVRYLLEHGESVALIPHVRWDHDDDLDILRQIKASFATERRVMLVDGDWNAMQLKGLIARLRCLIAARTHASIAAYSSGVPALVLGYSVKARGIRQDLLPDTDGTLLPVQALSQPHQLIEGYEALAENAQRQRLRLKEALPAYTEAVRSAARDLAVLAGWRHA